MVKIRVILHGANESYHCCQHILALIEDVDTRKALQIEFGSQSSGFAAQGLTVLPDSRYEGHGIMFDTVELSSSKSFDEFLNLYSAQFSGNKYRFFNNNCADAVNFMLDYFFPPEEIEKKFFSKVYELLCCFSFVLSCGLNCFAPLPSCITTPKQIFKKAQFIAKINDESKEEDVALDDKLTTRLISI